MEKEKLKSFFKKNKKIILGGCCVALGVGVIAGVMSSSDGTVSSKFKSSLINVAEKANLETVTFNYDIIAKECEDKNKCDMTSRNINDFKFVVSCRSSISASIEFDKIEVKDDLDNKKIIVTLPEIILETPNLLDLKFLGEVDGDLYTDGRKLCIEETENRSSSDPKFTDTIKDHTVDVVKNYYIQWAKALGFEDFSIEVN